MNRDQRQIPKLIFCIAFSLASYCTFSQTRDTLKYVDPTLGRFGEHIVITVLPEDTTHFCIQLKGTVTYVKLRGHWQQLQKKPDLATFMRRNRNVISQSKILIVAPASTKYPDFKFILDALKQNDLLKFNIATTD